MSLRLRSVRRPVVETLRVETSAAPEAISAHWLTMLQRR
jgi:hypothetical protein